MKNITNTIRVAVARKIGGKALRKEIRTTIEKKEWDAWDEAYVTGFNATHYDDTGLRAVKFNPMTPAMNNKEI